MLVPPKLQVTLLVWPDGATSDSFMVLSGLASSLGRPVAAGRPGNDKTDEAWAKCRKNCWTKLRHFHCFTCNSGTSWIRRTGHMQWYRGNAWIRECYVKLSQDMVRSAAKPMEGSGVCGRPRRVVCAPIAGWLRQRSGHNVQQKWELQHWWSHRQLWNHRCWIVWTVHFKRGFIVEETLQKVATRWFTDISEACTKFTFVFKTVSWTVMVVAASYQVFFKYFHLYHLFWFPKSVFLAIHPRDVGLNSQA